MEEIWRNIEGYEGLYQVSNYGKIISKHNKKDKQLKQLPNSRGYLRVMLSKNNKKEKMFVHRIVAKSFCENKNGYNVVNHIDSNHTNNYCENLEWTTNMGNMQHAIKKGRFIRTEAWLKNQRKSCSKYDKAVCGENIKNKNIIEFSSIQAAAKNGFQASCICNCCKGKRITHKGYTWKYKNA